jgi:RNA polymerase-binding transcription factor DksA
VRHPSLGRLPVPPDSSSTECINHKRYFLTECQITSEDAARDRTYLHEFKRAATAADDVQRATGMRQPHRFVARLGRHERHFTEAQIMKFTKPRDGVKGTESMTQRDVTTIRSRLSAERELVERSLRRNTQPALSESDDTNVLFRLRGSDLRRLKLIDDALSRIDHDGYGTCEHCGTEIGVARLEAIPWTTTCVLCRGTSACI